MSSESPIDSHLQYLVDCLNLEPTSAVTVTVIIGGSIVTGVAVSETEYLRTYGQLLSDGLSSEESDEGTRFKKVFGEVADMSLKQAEAFMEGEAKVKSAKYIHFRKAIIIQAGLSETHHAVPFVRVDSPLRIKLSRVDGFYLGQHEP